MFYIYHPLCLYYLTSVLLSCGNLIHLKPKGTVIGREAGEGTTTNLCDNRLSADLSLLVV